MLVDGQLHYGALYDKKTAPISSKKQNSKKLKIGKQNLQDSICKEPFLVVCQVNIITLNLINFTKLS